MRWFVAWLAALVLCAPAQALTPEQALALASGDTAMRVAALGAAAASLAAAGVAAFLGLLLLLSLGVVLLLAITSFLSGGISDNEHITPSNVMEILTLVA